jgi:multidrug efflux pump subunit AcrA (membrane-fusion protein)
MYLDGTRINMKQFVWPGIICAVLAVLGIGFVAHSGAEDVPRFTPTEPLDSLEPNLRHAYTQPDKEYKICFPTMGVIREVRIKEGDRVKKGDILMVQDDREEKAELKLLALDCNDLPIEGAQKKADAAKVDFDLKDLMKKDGAPVLLEWTQKKAEWEIAKVQVEQAVQEKLQKEAKRDKQDTHVKNMTLVSEVDGVVQEIINDVGSNVDPTKQCLTIVKNDPLIVIVQVPAIASLQLKQGDKLRVSYDKKNWREATVDFLSPQANALSGMRKIELKLPNPEGEPSGLRAFVELPDKLLASVNGK